MVLTELKKPKKISIYPDIKYHNQDNTLNNFSSLLFDGEDALKIDEYDRPWFRNYLKDDED
ncbi:MAG: hypothetical protein LUG12_08515 [Erysipelotrichaceae bacterium]|nr:hypothetical protein [Erysipelotrichaceae bacterium]